MKKFVGQILCVMVLLAFVSGAQAMLASSSSGLITLFQDDYELGTVGSPPVQTIGGGYWSFNSVRPLVTDAATPGPYQGQKYVEFNGAREAWFMADQGYGIVNIVFAANMAADSPSGSYFAFVVLGGKDVARFGLRLKDDGTVGYGGPAPTYTILPFTKLSDSTPITATLGSWHTYMLTYSALNGDLTLTFDGIVSNTVHNAEYNGTHGSVGTFWLLAENANHIFFDYSPATVCGDFGTKYSLADVAGPDGVGLAYRDCIVNFLDFSAMADLWLQCTDPGDPVNCPLGQ